MAFPSEFKYANEKHFINDMLKPLLARMGYSTIVDYHGTSEQGKDLIFAEVDRFGFFRYHAIQAKYTEKIGLSDGVRSLIEDCEQAFATPFRHPLTGAEERISTFYAINGGSISQEAQTFYFNALRPKFGANCQLIDGAYLVTLSRFVVGTVDQNIRARLAGVVLEIEWNLIALQLLEPSIPALCDEKSVNPVVNVERLRSYALTGYIAAPSVATIVDTRQTLMLLQWIEAFNGMMDVAARSLLVSVRIGAGNAMMQQIPELRASAAIVLRQFQSAIARLGGQLDGIPQLFLVPPQPAKKA
jgi:hypothetical protein